MKVAVISAHTCPLAAPGGKETGGMNVYVRETAKALSSRGLQLDIFTRSQNPNIPKEVQLAPGVRVIHIEAGPQRPYDKYHLLDHIARFIEGVIAYESTGYDVVHSHYWISGIIALELADRWKIPVIQMFHTLGALKNLVARAEGEAEKDIRIETEAQLCEEVDLIVASSPLEKAHLVWHYEAHPSKVRVVPCGVDVSLFAPRDRSEARGVIGINGRKTVIFVGRLEPIKGLDTLLKAISLLKRMKMKEGGRQNPPLLLIVGGEKDNGHSKASTHWISRQARSLGIEEDVVLVGPRPQEHLSWFYAASDLCVLPSRYESFGMVALEAMACGTPVVASRVGGLSYTVRDGDTGVLVTEGDPAILAESIGMLLEEEQLREEMGRRAVRWARCFAWDSIVEKILEIYESNLNMRNNLNVPLSC
jgi:D-inositol-3-phosphate glycosyltransferase